MAAARAAEVLDASTAEGIALIAHTSKSCGVPPHSSFELLDRAGAAMPLSPDASAWFSRHEVHRLPCDSGLTRLARYKSRMGFADELHCFTMQQAAAEPLNVRLNTLAHSTEKSSEHSGVNRSNQGGFQSRADLFTTREDADADRRSSVCRMLHSALAVALQELQPAAVARDPATMELPAACDTQRERGSNQAPVMPMLAS